MRYSNAFVLIWVLTTQSALAQSESLGLWNHNESVVSLFADGDTRVFRYDRPRPGMQAEGVRKGTLLFEGIRSDDTYEGTAYIFDIRCGAIPYRVSGSVSPDLLQITLIGDAPSALDSDCQPTAYERDVLEFEFLSKLAGSQPDEPVGKATKNHVEKNVCAPTIRDALSAAPKVIRALERSLISLCEECFADGVEDTFAQQEVAQLDLVLAGRTTSLDVATISRVQTKYNTLFATCSERIVQRMADDLGMK